MLPDKPKQRATQKSGRKDDAKDIARDGQLHAPSKRGFSDKDKDDPADARRVGDRGKPVPD